MTDRSFIDSPLWLDLAEPDTLREVAANTREATQGCSPVIAYLEAAARRIELLERHIERADGIAPAKVLEMQTGA